jgi:hypothetical protein
VRLWLWGFFINIASYSVTLEGLEWNTFENIVIKWSKVFNDIALADEPQDFAYITSHAV